MSATSGRRLLISRNGVLLGTAQVKSVEINREPVDATTTSGRQLLTAQARGSKVTLKVDGVARNSILLESAINRDGSTTVDIEWQGTAFSGSYALTNLTLTGGIRSAVTFAATLESADEFGGGGGGAPESATYVTTADETATLPSSRRIVAGDNVSFDTTTPGVVEINVDDPPDPGADPALVYVTVGDETADLPNSRRIVAGSNVSISTATGGQVVISASGGGGGGSANVNADTHPSSPDAADDEFETGSSIDGSKWTAFSLSTGSAVVAQGALIFKPALTNSRNVGGYTQPVSGSWGYTCKLAVSSFTNDGAGGMFVATSSGASGNILLFGLGGFGVTTLVQRLSNASTFSANQVATGQWAHFATPALQTVPLYLRITYDGTTLRFLMSSAGVEGSFNEVYSETSAAFLGTPALIGLGYDNHVVGTQTVLVCDWFRKTS